MAVHKRVVEPQIRLNCNRGAEMENERKADLESSLIETLTSSQLPEVLQDVAEVALDSLLDEGIAKDVPIVGTIVRLGEIAVTVRDYFLVRKVLLFLEGLDKTTPEQREAFIRKVESDSKYQQRVGETIMMLLDRYDHIDKASLMSKVLCACIEGEITYDEFLRISTAIDRAFIEDLNELLHYFASEEINRELGNRRNRTTRNVYMSNLSDFYVLTEEQAEDSGLEYPQIYHFNQYAIKFAKVVLGDRFHDGRW